MDLNHFKLDFSLFNAYINSMDKMHIVIDFSTVMRSNAADIFHWLRSLSRSRCCFYVSEKFDKQITQLIDDKETGFCSETALNSILPAWEEYSNLYLHTIDESTTPYAFFQQLSHNGYTTCLLTGNETEAWKHILTSSIGNVLLVTDSGSYFFVDSFFSKLQREFGSIEINTDRAIPEDNSGMCETSTMEKTFLFFSKRHTINFTDIISENGAEGIIYKTNEPEIAVKSFYQSVSLQKIKKLKHFIKITERLDNFAWPLEFTYSTNHSYSEPIGFTMPYFENIRPLEELQFLDKVSDRIRWKVAVSFLASTLFLYMHGIQIGDYNFNNFSITNDCRVVFMDVDSYVYGTYGTQVHGRQQLPFAPDYSKRYSIIKADYMLLNCMIFWILSDGIWPYYYNEDKGCSICRISIDSAKDFHDTLNRFPQKLKDYFQRLFLSGTCEDPFTLLFILFDTETDFT